MSAMKAMINDADDKCMGLWSTNQRDSFEELACNACFDVTETILSPRVT